MAELQVNLMIDRNGAPEPFNGFTAEEKEILSKRLSGVMSAYFTQHSKELN